ncbi:MAG: SRPBCC family protein [Prevotellaceae bacterium]|jgi:carbon monoxide dehydrogenase subunit G|nr:SRPBCC family protein [Prevotellaceae bacterium]
MEEYKSKTVKINRMASDVYGILSDLSKFGEIVPPSDEVQDFEATTDECTFKVKGMIMGIRIVEREENKTIKLTGTGKMPFEFFSWIQLKEVAPYDTRMRIVLHIKLNMMMKMFLKGKIQKGLDSAAERLAMGFNGQIPPQ